MKSRKQHSKKSKRNNEGDSASLELPPPCTCPYFGDKPCAMVKPIEVKIITTSSSSNFFSPQHKQEQSIKHHHQHQLNHNTSQFMSLSNNSISNNSGNKITTSSTISLPMASASTVTQPLASSLSQKHNASKNYSKCNSVVTWDSRRYQRRGSSMSSSTRTALLLTPTKSIINSSTSASPLRRSVTLRHNTNINLNNNADSLHPKLPSSPCILQRSTTIRSHHSRNSSVISRNSSRHGRIILAEQKATRWVNHPLAELIMFRGLFLKLFILSF